MVGISIYGSLRGVARFPVSYVTRYSVEMLMARDESIYQREQSQPGGRGGDQQLEAGVGIGKANAWQCFEIVGARRSRTDADANNLNSCDILTYPGRN